MGIKLRTEWELESGGPAIDHEAKILLVGSCFSEHISSKLRFSGFDVMENPHGIVFHPAAIERSVSDCLHRPHYKKEDLLFNGTHWASPNHHGRFNNTDPEVVLCSIHAAISKGHQFLNQASHLVLTLGTSWVYRHLQRDLRVANCHKIPQKEFRKELLSLREIQLSLQNAVALARQANSSMVIILTVSPVRHARDGMVENTLSKARLHQSLHELVSTTEGVHYFPAYELMMDDLRDYRFYKSDLIHPSEMAVEYIWEKFCKAWINPAARPLMEEAQSVHRALEHRPIHEDSESHKSFQLELQKRIDVLKKKYPHLVIQEQVNS